VVYGIKKRVGGVLYPRDPDLYYLYETKKKGSKVISIYKGIGRKVAGQEDARGADQEVAWERVRRSSRHKRRSSQVSRRKA